jgi:hypothetical protein
MILEDNVFVIESDLDLMTGKITNIREYHTSPGSEPVDIEKLAEEALNGKSPEPDDLN